MKAPAYQFLSAHLLVMEIFQQQFLIERTSGRELGTSPANRMALFQG